MMSSICRPSAAVYNALGQPQQAMVFLNRVQQHYAMQHAAAPADVEIQDAWLLFNGDNDAGLYRQLMVLGATAGSERRTAPDGADDLDQLGGAACESGCREWQRQALAGDPECRGEVVPG